MGNGLERAYSKNNFIKSGYNIREMIYNKILGPYTVWNQYLTIIQKKLRILWKKGDPWGDLSAPRATSDRSFLYFLSDLIKYSDDVRITYSQNHFNSNFGSAYLISKKMKLKLAKQAKKGTKESKLSLGSWLAVCAAN